MGGETTVGLGVAEATVTGHVVARVGGLRWHVDTLHELSVQQLSIPVFDSWTGRGSWVGHDGRRNVYIARGMGSGAVE